MRLEKEIENGQRQLLLGVEDSPGAERFASLFEAE